MAAQKLTVWIAGREAIPVRAIPYVALSRLRLDPKRLVQDLAQKEKPLWLGPLTAYHAVDGQPVAINPIEWNEIIGRLDGREAKLRRRYPGTDDGRDDEGYAEWLRSSVLDLPSNAFLWLDEFEQAWQTYHARLNRAEAGTGHAASPSALNLTPMIAEDVANIVLAGFRVDESESLQMELICNGKEIDWRYWCGVIASPEQAAKLTYRIDPIKHKGWNFAQGSIPAGLQEKIERLTQWLANQSSEWNLSALVTAVGDLAPQGMRNAVRDTMPETRLDHAGSILPDGDAPKINAKYGSATEPGLNKRERQIRAILSVADALAFNPLKIPDNGKTKIGAICRSKHKDLFGVGVDPFKEAWQEAVTQRRIRMLNHEKYSSRR